MLTETPNYINEINNVRQLFTGLGLIIIGLMYPVSDIFIALKKEMTITYKTSI